MQSPLDKPFRTDDKASRPDLWWKFGGTALGIGTATAVRLLMEQGRRRLSRTGDVPLNPADERMGWLPALTWAAFIAVGGALGRLLTQRALAAAWRKRTHRPVAAMPSA